MIGAHTDPELAALQRAIHERGVPGHYRKIVFYWKGDRRLATVFVSDKRVEAERSADGQWELDIWTQVQH